MTATPRTTRSTAPRSSPPRIRPRTAATVAASAMALGTALALAAPLAASAHVTVSPNQVSAGSYTLIDVKAPTESETASTTKVVVEMPTETPILSVLYVPVPGWTTEVTTEKLPKPITAGDDEITQAVTRVTWTATDGGIPVGGIGVFPLNIGPVPDVGSIRFPARQSYSDGSVVDWTETAADAEHPAPTLYVNDAPPGEHGATHDEPSVAPAAGGGSGAGSTTAASADPVARGLGIAGLAIGAIGIVVAVAAIVSSRRRTPSAVGDRAGGTAAPRENG